jgi:Zn-dependent protease
VFGSGGKRWKVATVRGIPLYVGTSWVFIAAVFVYSQYLSLTEGVARSSPSEALWLSLFTATLFFGGVLVHEAAHAVMARSLDLPVRGISLVFMGGFTETRANAGGPLGEFLVAVVGPTTTLALAIVFWASAHVAHGLAADSLHWLSRICFIFAGLNALPGFPLDGGRMLLAAAWGATGRRASALRIAGYVGMVVGGALVAVAVFDYSTLAGYAIFVGYIGAVMIATGRGMGGRASLLEKLATGRAGDAMREPPPSVPADMTLGQALDLYLRDARGEAFPVTDAGRVIGMVSLESARRAGARDPMRPVRDGMSSLTQTPAFAPEEQLDGVVEWLAGREGLVLREGQLVGAIGGDDIERWYKRTFEGREDAWSAATGYSPDPGAIPPRPDL